MIGNGRELREEGGAVAGVAVRRMPTPWGFLSYSLTEEGGKVRVRIENGLTVPGGIVFRGQRIENAGSKRTPL